MIYLIDTSYFWGELNIAQINQASVAAKVNLMIAKYEPEYLRKMLGYQLFKDAEAFAVPYDIIKSGGEFFDARGHLDTWDGLVNAAKVSPIANYVYFKYMIDFESTTTGSGEKKNKKGDGAESISPWPKAVRAWNEMVRMNKKLVWFLKGKADFNYPSYVYGSNELLKVLNPVI